MVQSSIAGLTGTELELTRKIIASLDEEYSRNSKIYFVDDEDYPFTLPGCRNKLACTPLLSVGSGIFLNTKLIKYNESNNNYILLPEASSIIAHEFGHHHNISNEEFLLNYGAKVRRSMSKENDTMLNRWRKKQLHHLFYSIEQHRNALTSFGQ